jgi:hypothetical protein
MFLYQLGCYATVTSQLGVAGIGNVCGSNDEFDHSFDIADGFDFGNACAISQPQTVFSVSYYCSLWRLHTHGIILIQWFGIQIVTVTSRMLWGQQVSSLFSKG